jgi:hypothetical protein
MFRSLRRSFQARFEFSFVKNRSQFKRFALDFANSRKNKMVEFVEQRKSFRPLKTSEKERTTKKKKEKRKKMEEPLLR